ncbi:MAG: menaquinone biosynthesis protein [Bryocella sp.]
MPLRVSAISFLNPAPLLYDFEHEPRASELAREFERHYTTPAECARELEEGTADLGLIPVASLTDAMRIVPGCTIASLGEVRSILLLVKKARGREGESVLEGSLQHVRVIASDAASRSSQTYLRILFEHFHGVKARFVEMDADAPQSVEWMLAEGDAALLIGDPALLARERRGEIDPNDELLWLDVAAMWQERTSLPWVAAVWAVRPEALGGENVSAERLTEVLIASRDAGLAHVAQIVQEWTPRLAVPAATIDEYLRTNIHYVLDEECVRAIEVFRELAADVGALEPMRRLRFL